MQPLVVSPIQIDKPMTSNSVKCVMWDSVALNEVLKLPHKNPYDELHVPLYERA